MKVLREQTNSYLMVSSYVKLRVKRIANIKRAINRLFTIQLKFKRYWLASGTKQQAASSI
jgi:hypothetical protein